MKTLHPIQFLGSSPIKAAGLVLTLAALPLLAWQGYLAYDEATLMRSERDALRAMGQRPKASGAQTMSAADRQRHAQIDALAAYLATPWAQRLAVFEDHAGDKATLHQIEQAAQAGTVKVTARASNTDNMVVYLKALQNDPRLAEVRLVRQELLRTEPGVPVQFDLTASFAAEAQSLPLAQAAAAPARVAPAKPRSPL